MRYQEPNPVQPWYQTLTGYKADPSRGREKDQRNLATR